MHTSGLGLGVVVRELDKFDQKDLGGSLFAPVCLSMWRWTYGRTK